MRSIAHANENADQVAFWNGPDGDLWVQWHTMLDASLDRLAMPLIDAAQVKVNERVIDVGCGCGSTTIQLGDTVGLKGEVLGIDISEPMVTFARRRAAAHPQVRFDLVDAAVATFDTRAYDLVFSRFGVMFFRDPVKAFVNLRRALKADGRLAFLCWQPIEANEWALMAARAALTILPPPRPPDPDQPGPFALADPNRLRSILFRAGFVDVLVSPAFGKIQVGASNDIDRAVEVSLGFGALRTMLEGVDATTLDRVRQAVRSAFEAIWTPDGAWLDAATWLVTARNEV